MRFEDEMRQNLISIHPSTYGNFESIFLKTLEANTPTITKIVRANDKPHMIKDLRKAMRKRSTLKTVANNSKREEDVRKYKDQRNLVVKLNIQAKRQHFKSLQSKTINDYGKDGGPHFTQCMIGICPLATHIYQNLQLQHKILTTATIDLGRPNFIAKSTRIWAPKVYEVF